MLGISRSNIETTPYGAPKQPFWDSGIVNGITQNQLVKVKDPFSQAYAKAMREEARKSPDIHSDSAALLQIGDFHFVNGSFGRAEQAYKDAARVSEDKTQSFTKLIQVFQAQKKPQKAVSYYDLLAETSIDSLPFEIEKIAYAINNINTIGKAEVASLLEAADKKYPRNEDVANLRGVYSLINNDLEDAKKYFGKVIYLNSKNVHGNNNLGVVYAKIGDTQKAIEYYKQALKCDSNYMVGYENIASIYTAEEKFDKALAILDDAKSNGLQLTYQWDHHYGFLLLRNGKIEEATAWYEDKLKQESDNYLLYVNLAKCYEILGKSKDSIMAAENAGKLARNLIESGSVHDDRVWLAYHNLMVIYDRSADDDSLLETANFVLKHNKQDWQAKYFKALVQLRRDDYVEGKKLLESANSIQPNSPEILLNLAFIYETVDKDYDKALETLRKAESNLDQPSTLLQNNIAYALLKKGDVDAAGKILESENINKEHPVFLATYGLYYYHRDDVKKADKYYKLSVQAFRGKEKQLAIQLWHTEKARYYLRHNNLVNALQEINIAAKALKSGYSYDDALALKEVIIGKLEAIVLNNASATTRA